MRYLILSVLLILLTISESKAQQPALHIVNAQRAAVGIYPLRLDPRLQAHAEAEMRAMLRQGRFRGHLGGRWSGAKPGRGEGVGYRSLNSDPHGYRFTSCFQATRKHRYGGAATGVVGNQRLYILIVN